MGRSGPRARLPLWLALTVAVGALLVAMTVSVSHGAVSIAFPDVWAVMAHRGLRLPVGLPTDPTAVEIVWTLRAPRTVLAALVGAGLALAGTAAQALIRNPLADPYILGVSGGASLLTVTAIVVGLGSYGLASTAFASFVGAVGSLGLVLVFGLRRGVISPLRLVLAGIAIGELLAGLTSFMVLRADEPQKVYSILFWLAGSLDQAAWSALWLPSAAVVIGALILLFDAARLNALIVGDETAASLGISVARLRWRLLLVTSLLTALMVSQSGIIGFVGLVVPHVARLVVGADHRRVVPMAAVTGAAFMVLCDLASRTVIAPTVIPVGIVTGVVGAPFFLWLLRRADTAR